MELLRSLLSVPGIRPNMLERARNLPADALVLDLEDSVPTGEKEKARELVQGNLAGMAQRGQKVFVRINSVETGLAELDLGAIVSQPLDGISLPKPASPQEVRWVDAIISALERQRGLEVGRIRLLAWIENARGMVQAYEIASASPRVVGICFGADDFTLDMDIQRTEEGVELAYPRAWVAVAARAANVLAIDTPYNAFTDEAGLVLEAQMAKKLGYQGKNLIHPSQIEPVNRVFRPTDEEIAQARRVVEVFEEGVARGVGAVALEGRLVDVPIAERARKLLAWAEAIAERERAGVGS